MALRAGYKGFKKLLPGLKIIRPGALGIDDVELSKTFFTRSEQAVLGAKNWFNIDAPNTVYNATLTKTDTSLRVQGSSNTYSNVNYVFRHLSLNTEYILKTNADYTSGIGKVSVEGSTDGSSYTTIASKANITSDQDVSISFNTGNYTYIRMIFFCSDSVAIDGDITYSYIMIKLASDPDDTYVPYAMTNEELTENKWDKTMVLASGDLDDYKTAGMYYWSTTAPSHSPENLTFCKMIVFVGAGSIHQVVLRGNGYVAMRQYEGSEWKSWYKFTSTEITP